MRIFRSRLILIIFFSVFATATAQLGNNFNFIPIDDQTSTPPINGPLEITETGYDNCCSLTRNLMFQLSNIRMSIDQD